MITWVYCHISSECLRVRLRLGPRTNPQWWKMTLSGWMWKSDLFWHPLPRELFHRLTRWLWMISDCKRKFWWHMSCSLGSLKVELPGQCKVMLILNISTLLHQAAGIRMLYGHLKMMRITWWMMRVIWRIWVLNISLRFSSMTIRQTFWHSSR